MQKVRHRAYLLAQLLAEFKTFLDISRELRRRPSIRPAGESSEGSCRAQPAPAQRCHGVRARFFGALHPAFASGGATNLATVGCAAPALRFSDANLLFESVSQHAIIILCVFKIRDVDAGWMEENYFVALVANRMGSAKSTRRLAPSAQ